MIMNGGDSHKIKRVYGAGILPYSKHKGKILFLLGKERWGKARGTWADFGGKRISGERPRETALREWQEESGMSRAPLLRMNRFVDVIDRRNGGCYRMYCVEIPYDQNLDGRALPDDMEKSQMKYFEMGDIVKTLGPPSVSEKRFRIRRCFGEGFIDCVRKHERLFVRS